MEERLQKVLAAAGVASRRELNVSARHIICFTSRAEW